MEITTIVNSAIIPYRYWLLGTLLWSLIPVAILLIIPVRVTPKNWRIQHIVGAIIALGGIKTSKEKQWGSDHETNKKPDNRSRGSGHNANGWELAHPLRRPGTILEEDGIPYKQERGII